MRPSSSSRSAGVKLELRFVPLTCSILPEVPAPRELLFWCHRASEVRVVSDPGARPPSEARAGEAALAVGHRGGGRQGWGEASPGAQPTVTQVEREGEPRARDLHGGKGMELGRIPSWDTVQGVRMPLRFPH